MPDGKHVAAIDAGSNGLRMAVAAVGEDGSFAVIESRREAVRLGRDVFDHGSFGSATIDEAVRAFEIFRQRLDAHRVHHLRAVATSAAREADNGDELVRRIAEATGIHVQIIDAPEEARLMLRAAAGEIDLRDGTALLIDMGGGSVEVTAARDGRAMACESMPLGPVRLLQNLRKWRLEERDAGELLAHHETPVAGLIRAGLGEAPPRVCIGVGGNIECLGELREPMLGEAHAKRIMRTDLDRMVPALLAMPIHQRIEQLGLRPDRADLIALAAMVLRMIVKQASVPEVRIPSVGLKEGLLREVAQRAVGEGGG